MLYLKAIVESGEISEYIFEQKVVEPISDTKVATFPFEVRRKTSQWIYDFERTQNPCQKQINKTINEYLENK